jgi:hypothetical protein
MSKNNTKSITPSSGFLSEMLSTVRLILRLLGDSRVSPLLKLLPIGSLIYWASPVDLMPGLPFDDAAVVLSAMYFFIEMCPAQVVAEHRAALANISVSAGAQEEPPTEPQRRADVIDGEFYDPAEHASWQEQHDKEPRREP